jgi:hypothetical protein
MITEANAESFTQDALILVARLASGPWLSVQIASMVDTDLHRIRTRCPAVAEVHALPDFILTELSLGLDLDAPWLEGWTKGRLHTGEVTVDGLLHAVHTTAVQDVGESPTFTRWLEERNHERAFQLTFAQPLNIRKLSERLQATSRYFHSVQPQGIVGDGDRITLEQLGDQKCYTFSRGWGDCPAGCTARHYWEVTLRSGGDMRLREYGDPLP